jgi:hypothetical protein
MISSKNKKEITVVTGTARSIHQLDAEQDSSVGSRRKENKRGLSEDTSCSLILGNLLFML